MKKSLPILAALLIVTGSAISKGQNPQFTPGQPPAQPPQATASGERLGERMVDQVVANLDAAPSLTAKIRHRIELMGRPLIGTGDYAQQGRGPSRSFHLNLQLRTSLAATTIEQVCNGQQLWIFEELDGQKHLSLVDLARLQRAVPKPRTPPASPMVWLRLGGLPKLLLGLQDSFQFGEIVESRLDELRVWSVEGYWNSEQLARMLPEQIEIINAGRQADLNQLTPNVPHRVVLHVGMEDLFPYRIEYWRTDTGEEGTSEPKVRLMAVMEWYEVQVGGHIDPARFQYQPPENLTPSDRTKDWLDRLGVEDPPAAQVNRRLDRRRR